MAAENDDGDTARRRWIYFADLLFCAGMAAQGWGIFALFGPEITAIVVGIEVAALGLTGAFRLAG